jgi:hypothetical protein
MKFKVKDWLIEPKMLVFFDEQQTIVSSFA